MNGQDNGAAATAPYACVPPISKMESIPPTNAGGDNYVPQ